MQHLSWLNSPLLKKNRALSIIAEQLEQQAPLILAENAKDIDLAKQNGLSDAFD